MSASAVPWNVATCPECERPNVLVGPLHGELGGPPFCLQCGAAWYGKHGRKRKFGRIVRKAIRIFLDAGGTNRDVDRLTLQATGDSFGKSFSWLNFGDETDAIGLEAGDLTVELLDDVLRLTHPDVHPPERHELATRVTRELVALKPFVFPAPQREPVPQGESNTEPPLVRPRILEPSTSPQQPAYPCSLCRDHSRYYYCTACKAEWTRRQEEQREAQRQKERAWYRARKARARWRRRRPCVTCGTPFDPKRQDQQHCGAACRQRAHRRRHVTDTTSTKPELERLVTVDCAGAPHEPD
jgi:hypothetical protein